MPRYNATQALQRLHEGNQRFVSNVRDLEVLASQTRRGDLIKEQEPVAIILGCSDSRAPAETIFDQGMGDLFVIRVAGNIVAPSLVGSVEFAADRFETRLVVVMGHSHCGAVGATVQQLRNPTESRSKNLSSIVNRIRPSVQPLIDAGLGDDEERLVAQAVRANIRASCDHLRHGSALLEDLIATEGLLVVGAEYSLETGEVDFFDGIPG